MAEATPDVTLWSVACDAANGAGREDLEDGDWLEPVWEAVHGACVSEETDVEV